MATSESLLHHLQEKLFGHPTWLASLRASGSHESGMNRFGRHIMGLSKFPDTLARQFHFGGDIGNESLCSEISLIRRHCCFSNFAF
jgi:hypothetical protein